MDTLDASLKLLMYQWFLRLLRLGFSEPGRMLPCQESMKAQETLATSTGSAFWMIFQNVTFYFNMNTKILESSTKLKWDFEKKIMNTMPCARFLGFHHLLCCEVNFRGEFEELCYVIKGFHNLVKLTADKTT